MPNQSHARSTWKEIYRLARLTPCQQEPKPNTTWGMAYDPKTFAVAINAAWCGTHGDKLHGGIDYRANLHRAGIDRNFLLNGSIYFAPRLPA